MNGSTEPRPQITTVRQSTPDPAPGLLGTDALDELLLTEESARKVGTGIGGHVPTKTKMSQVKPWGSNPARGR